MQTKHQKVKDWLFHARGMKKRLDVLQKRGVGKLSGFSKANVYN